jgi:hypothetical protein
MKPATRDNIIYVGVGVIIASIIVVSSLIAEIHGRKMWYPSRFSFHVFAYLLLLDYFIARETHGVRATLAQTVTCVLTGSALHLGIAFAFRTIYGGHLTLWLFGLALVEFFAIVQLMVQAVVHLRTSGNT